MLTENILFSVNFWCVSFEIGFYILHISPQVKTNTRILLLMTFHLVVFSFSCPTVPYILSLSLPSLNNSSVFYPHKEVCLLLFICIDWFMYEGAERDGRNTIKFKEMDKNGKTVSYRSGSAKERFNSIMTDFDDMGRFNSSREFVIPKKVICVLQRSTQVSYSQCFISFNYYVCIRKQLIISADLKSSFTQF